MFYRFMQKNRLDAKRMRNLVYVQFHSKLLDRKKKKDKHDILSANNTSIAQAWIAEVDDHDVESQGSTSILDEMVSDLDENNFGSKIKNLIRILYSSRRMFNVHGSFH